MANKIFNPTHVCRVFMEIRLYIQIKNNEILYKFSGDKEVGKVPLLNNHFKIPFRALERVFNINDFEQIKYNPK